ncbi:SAM-dependent methyltransferase [Streptomyces celluloflavus]|uniref:SAM-dependent methyltransferase n=1 Tax=Streptomyces celluloflavus TaxID=58344 RepID=UPI0034600E44|nr:SAM-dependent methyltransferase [Streptomyces celluloflavus]
MPDRATPDVFDISTPSVARMYDYLLDGKDHFPSDRAACETLLRRVPSMKKLAFDSRAFVRRVVHALAAQYGVRQFIEYGSGLPTRGNIHEVAQHVDPHCRVVYVDNDPLVRSVGAALLQRNANTVFIEADMRDTKGIFEHPKVESFLDRKEPVAALFVSVLHCIPDEDDPKTLVRRVADCLVPGSFMAICQLVSNSPGLRASVSDFMQEQTRERWGRVRERRDVQEYFEHLQVEEPGLVEVSQWRAADRERRAWTAVEWEEYGGLGKITR